MNANVAKVVMNDDRNKGEQDHNNKADFVSVNEGNLQIHYNNKGIRKGENEDITIEGCMEVINEKNIVTDTATRKLTDSGSV